MSACMYDWDNPCYHDCVNCSNCYYEQCEDCGTWHVWSDMIPDGLFWRCEACEEKRFKDDEEELA